MTSQKYLTEHGITQVSVDKFGLEDLGDRLKIPIKDKNGNVLFNKYRHLNHTSNSDVPKYTFDKGNSAVLFNPNALDKSNIVICEGEIDCIRLDQENIPAITGTAGASTFSKDWIELCKSKTCFICYDSDKPGQENALRVAQKLTNQGVDARIVNLPEDCKDVCDFFSKGHTKEEFIKLCEETEKIDLDEENQSPEEEVEEDLPQTKQVLKLISEGKTILFHDQFNSAYMAPYGNGKLTFQLKSRKAINWLTYLYWDSVKLTLNPTALQSIIRILEAKALYEGPQIELSVRVTKQKDVIWYDLGSKAVQITSEGWNIIEEPPIFFKQFAHQKSQVEPKRSGKPEELLEFLNLNNSSEKLLILCWGVFGLVPKLPHPAAFLNGPQGSKKSTFQKVFKELLDPSSVHVHTNPTSINDFVQTTSHNWFLVLDNITGLPGWLSDAMCRVITGGGFSKRELYSDDDDIVYNFQHIIGVNGINLVAEKADLLERSLIFSLKRTNKFTTEKIFWSRFGERKPYILGALFDVLVKTIQILKNTPEPDEQFRMADFAYWGSAIAKALGYSSEDFIEAYKSNISHQNEEALNASPVGTAIIHLMASTNEWFGTPTQLLTELERVALKLKIDQKARSWPKDARWLWKRISEILPNLETEGINADRNKDDSRSIILTKEAKNDVSNVGDVGGGSHSEDQADIKDNTDNISINSQIAESDLPKKEEVYDQRPKLEIPTGD